MIQNRKFIALLLTILVAALLAGACGQKEEAVEKQVCVVDSVASADGVMIHYMVEGTGSPTIVLVHCWCCDRTYWNEQFPELAANYQVVAVDLAGHGESALGRKDYTMEAYAQDVAAVINKVNPEKVILVGHSMGGAVIIETARLLPEKVVGLIGIDNFQNFEQKFTDEQIAGYLGALNANFAGTTKMMVNGMFAPDADSTVKANIMDDMSSAPTEVGISSMSNLVRYDYATALAEVKAPIYNVNSSVHPTNVEGNRTLATSFDVMIMDSVGHFPMFERPDEFTEALEDVITKLTVTE